MIEASNLAKAEATDVAVVQHACELLQELSVVPLPFRAHDGLAVEAYIGDGNASRPSAHGIAPRSGDLHAI